MLVQDVIEVDDDIDDPGHRWIRIIRRDLIPRRGKNALELPKEPSASDFNQAAPYVANPSSADEHVENAGTQKR